LDRNAGLGESADKRMTAGEIEPAASGEWRVYQLGQAAVGGVDDVMSCGAGGCGARLGGMRQRT
jgi:hypothetical protein